MESRRKMAALDSALLNVLSDHCGDKMTTAEAVSVLLTSAGRLIALELREERNDA